MSRTESAVKLKLGSIVVKLSRKSLTVTTEKSAKAASRSNSRKNHAIRRMRRTIKQLREEVTAWEEGRVVVATETFHRVID